MSGDLVQLVNRIDNMEAVRRRAVQDAIASATAKHWARRAADFEAAIPRPGDHPGGPVDWETGRPLAPTRGRVSQASEVAAACRFQAAALQAGWW